ncbi:MAG: hypothetical protein IJ154_06880 [Bacteroidales bacterium]|nr:hypothetical protein [Bacteroidales bacterium]
MNKKCLLLGGFLIPFVFAIAQEDAYNSIRSFVSHIETFNRILPQEKVYLHFDNTSYFLGETIWFSAYVVRADNHRPTDISGILHVQLLTQEGVIIDSRKLKIEQGRCHGEFLLDSKERIYYSGYYEVRAYTQYMLNFGMIPREFQREIRAFFYNEDFLRRFFQESGTAFSRVFPVYERPRVKGNHQDRTIMQRPSATLRYEQRERRKPDLKINFYPEGGNLIIGLQSRIAFEASTDEGERVEVAGRVYDTNGECCDTLQTTGRGRGSFLVTPQGHKTGTVRVLYQGFDYRFDLPEAEKSGYAMSVDMSSPKEICVYVQRSAVQAADTVGVSVVCRGRPVSFQAFVPDNAGSSLVTISTDILPTGVNQITLFDARGRIYAERLVFVNHHEHEQRQIKMDAIYRAYQPYDSVGLTFSFPPEMAGQSFSLSVCDRQSRETGFGSRNMLTDLLLSSDLYGYIEHPDYYFLDDNPQRAFELDLLLMVQGWRRYDWQSMAGVTNFSLEYPAEKHLRISGRIYPVGGTGIGKRIRQSSQLGIEAYFTDGKLELEGSDHADDKGYFQIDFPDFEGSGTLFVKIHDGKRWWWKKNGDFLNPREISHMLTEFIPIKENYVPLSKVYDYYENHPPVNRFWEDDSELTAEELSSIKRDNEAYIMSLPEAEIKNKRKTLVFGKPAVKLNPLDELNFQMDMGMYFGFVSKELVALNACVRLGMRGEFESLINNVPVSYTDREEDWIWGNDGHRLTEFYNYMYGWGTTVVQADGSERRVHKEKEQSLVSRGRSFRSIWRGRNIEYAQSLSLYFDKTGRGFYQYKDVRHDYTASFLYNYKMENKMNPLLNGRKMTFHGYSVARDFYHPDYRLKTRKEMPEDFRRTLYWNPEVRIDPQGKARVAFYNNGTARRLFVSAEGLGPDGQILVLEK